MLRISIVQMDVEQKDIHANLEKTIHFVHEAKAQGAQLICFPEMWTTGFDFAFNSHHATQQDSTLNTLRTLAKHNQLWIAGSLLYCNDQGKPTNSLMVFNDQGEIAARYDKIHLFSYMKEDQHVHPGDQPVTLDAPWGKMGLSICYDIRFCELFRTYGLQNTNIILAPSAFPLERIDHWRTLVRARAIENQLFMIGINHVGYEDHSTTNTANTEYGGHSCVVDPWGIRLLEMNYKQEGIQTIDIDNQQSQLIRDKMTVFKDRRPNCYQL